MSARDSMFHELMTNEAIRTTRSGLFGGRDVIVCTPSGGKGAQDKMWLHAFHQQVISIKDTLQDETCIFDFSNLEKIPLSLIGIAFALKEELAEKNSRLLLTGINPDAISTRLLAVVIQNFTVCQRSEVIDSIQNSNAETTAKSEG